MQGGPEVQKLRAHYMDGLYTMTTFNWISISILYLTLVSIVQKEQVQSIKIEEKSFEYFIGTACWLDNDQVNEG